MDISSFNSVSATSSYISQLLSDSQSTASDPSTVASTASTPSAAQVMQQLTASPANLQTQLAQETLSTQQAALGKELESGLAASGTSLSGEVSFTLDASGQVSVQGSTADQTAVQNYFQSDTSNPSLESRIASALTSAQTLSQTTQQDNAISMAARYAGPASNLMSMYQQFMGEAQNTSATMTLGTDGTSTLSYPGALNSQA